jgi:hemolysin activation/secretion protein
VLIAQPGIDVGLSEDLFIDLSVTMKPPHITLSVDNSYMKKNVARYRSRIRLNDIRKRFI